MKTRILARLVAKSISLVDQIADQKHWHFSFLVRKNAIISVGMNQPKKTSPMPFNFGETSWPFTHSEVAALSRAVCGLQDLKKCILVNIRLSKRLTPLMSRPCGNCSRIIQSMGVGRTLYTNNFGKFEEMAY